MSYLVVGIDRRPKFTDLTVRHPGSPPRYILVVECRADNGSEAEISIGDMIRLIHIEFLGSHERVGIRNRSGDTMKRFALLLIVVPLLAFQPGAPERLDAISLGAKADGQADDTSTLQAALDDFNRPAHTGVLTLPVGTYRITRTLVYRGNHGYGATVQGSIAAAGPSGTVLKWDGPVGGTVLELRGAMGTTVERIAINGCGKAATGIAVSFDTERNIGSSNVTLSHLHIGGVTDTAIAIGILPDGSDDMRQVDAITINRCLLVGHGSYGSSRFGINTGWGNVKNFSIRDTLVNGFQTGIRHGGSGFMIVDGFAGGNNTYSDFVGRTANFEIRAGNSEGSARLYAGLGIGSHSGSLAISNFSWSGDSKNQPIVSYQGFLKLSGNYFRNVSGAPRIELNLTPGSPVSCVSEGNYYRSASGQPPIFDTHGRIVPSSYIQSFGDYGGVEGRIEMLRPPAGVFRGSDLILSGSIDFGDGRSWTRDGIHLSRDRRWTDDGLYPGGGVKWSGAGALIGRSNGNLDWVDWVDRTSSTVVMSGRDRNNKD